MRHFRTTKDIEEALAGLYREHRAELFERDGRTYARLSIDCECGACEVSEWPLAVMAETLERKLS